MPFSRVCPGRVPVVAVSLLLAAALPSCANGPEGGYTPPGASTAGRAVVFNTGRLTVVAVDQDGVPMYGARIDVDSDEPEFYRTTGTLDPRGSVTFTGVPQEVRVSVIYPGAYYSRPFFVPPTGTTEMRMIVTVDGGVPRPTPQPVPQPRVLRPPAGGG